MTFTRSLSLVPVAALVVALAACSNNGGESATTPEPSAATAVTSTTSAAPSTSAAPATSNSETSSSQAAPAVTTPATMPATQREKAAMLLMAPAVNFDDALYKLNAGVGGIFIPSWADPSLLTQPGRDIHALREIVGRPFDVAIDFEGGRVQRFSQILGAYPSPGQMAAEGPQAVRGYGFRIGEALRARGITVNFAPVLDLDGNGLQVVGDRAFTTDPVDAAGFGINFARGLEDAGVQGVFKHYPGHGRASGDTHHQTAVTPPLDQMMAFDAVPFKRAVEAQPSAAVMVGHMVVPGLGDGHTPSSLNSHAYGLLRNVHGFQGIAYTDDLTGMRAITDHYNPAQAVVAALSAGADVALWSNATDINWVIDEVDRAVTEGRIHPARFEAATMRVAQRLAE